MRRLVAGLVGALTAAACGLPETGPIALDDRFDAVPGEAATLDVLANDRPPAGEQLTIVGVTGGRGDVHVDGGMLRYQAPDESGTDTFSYEVTADGESLARADVEVTVGSDATTTTAPTTTTSEVRDPTTTAGRPPRAEPASLDFGVVGAGAIASRTVTLVAGDEPWSPDWSGIGSGDAAELSIVDTCPSLSPGEECTVDVVWNATRPLDATLRLHDDLPYALHGRVAPIELTPVQQTEAVDVGGATDVTFGIVAPSSDPVDVELAVARGPDGTEIVSGCEVLERRCDPVVRIPVDTPGEQPPVLVEVITPTDRLTARIVVIGIPEPPEWVVPTDGQELWIELAARGMTVRHAEVSGADDVTVTAFLCADDDCAVELLTDRVEGSPTDVDVVAPDSFDVTAWYASVVQGGSEPRLRLQAIARVGEVASPTASVVALLVAEPIAASWQSYTPAEPPPLCADLTIGIAVESHLLEPVSLVARVSGDGSGDQELSDVFVVAPGTPAVTATVPLAFALERIDLVPAPEIGPAQFPDVPVTGAPEYLGRSCLA